MKANNAFKQNTNSRFSSLKDEITTDTKQNNNKDVRNSAKQEIPRQSIYDQPRSNAFQRPTTFRDRIQNEKEKLEKEKQRKQLELEKSLTDSNSFPELIPTQAVKVGQAREMNYIDKVTWVKEEVVENNEDDWLPVGFEKLEDNKNDVKCHSRAGPVDPAKVLKKLVDLYENWKRDYINTWGLDDYESRYLFPNYDYEYMDKLDEKHEYDMLKQEDAEREKQMEYEYSNDYEQYDDYN